MSNVPSLWLGKLSNLNVARTADRGADPHKPLMLLTVIDHTNGPEHQLLFFKERFLPKDHPDRSKMDRFSAKLRKLGLREETIGYGPSKEEMGGAQSRLAGKLTTDLALAKVPPSSP